MNPYREGDKPPRHIVQICSSESDAEGAAWSIVLHALDDRGDVWRLLSTPKGEDSNFPVPGKWRKLPPIPQDEDDVLIPQDEDEDDDEDEDGGNT